MWKWLLSFFIGGLIVSASEADVRARIVERGDLDHVTVEEQLAIVDQLAAFPLGAFLLEHGLLDGHWTDYILTLRQSVDIDTLAPLERMVMFELPLSKAFHQRFATFNRILEEELQPGYKCLSIPSGTLPEFRTIDPKAVEGVKIVAVDWDPAALEEAASLVNHLDVDYHCLDAWEFRGDGSGDLLISNGLNFYIPEDDKVTDLYRIFHDSLKPGAMLVTSILTPMTEWKFEKIDPEMGRLARVIFVDILDGKWQCYRSVEETRAQLNEAGFDQIEVVYDEAHLFPTIIARRANA